MAEFIALVEDESGCPCGCVSSWDDLLAFEDLPDEPNPECGNDPQCLMGAFCPDDEDSWDFPEDSWDFPELRDAVAERHTKAYIASDGMYTCDGCYPQSEDSGEDEFDKSHEEDHDNA